MLDVYVDADGCPVKDEVYRVARRCDLSVTLVANKRMARPPDAKFRLVVVGNAFDAADDWIVEHVAADDIVVTADIPLAARCLKRDARVIGVRGDVFTNESIGDALASRDLLSTLRDSGLSTSGPAPFVPRDRSRFLQRLDEIVEAIRRGKPAR